MHDQLVIETRWDPDQTDRRPDHLLARRKISERVADGVRAALDVDETTMLP